MPELPRSRPSRAVVEAVRPIVDAGRFPAKAAVGEPLTVEADVFTDGHAVVAAALRHRRAGGDGRWIETMMTFVDNDRHRAVIVPDACGRWEYDVLGWVDHLETWRRDTVKKVAAGLDVSVELRAGAALVAEARRHATGQDADALAALAARLDGGDASGLADATWTAISFRTSPRDPVAQLPRPAVVEVDPVLASFGAWYEFFPRSTVSGLAGRTEPVGGDLRAAVDRLDYVAAMGFDVVYLPPISPIGTVKRKGRNNTVVAEDGDVGSPWAIGSEHGGHTAVAPELGTVDDVTALAAACRERGMHLALDIAFQCAPDHPWVREHPGWFAHRADGSIQYAENPPKKYEDIYPLDFETDDWHGLWQALADVFRFWIRRGVQVFRVDNPHTKAFAFWEWALATLRAEHPEAIFLAEAFTRPRVMERLAKIGFNQSYTYFAWRQSAWELREYFEELSTRTVDYFRPNAWPNTPDILTEQLQHGGRAAFVSRAILAATLSPSWGIYGPAFELLEHRAVRPGSEEYLDSEKYQLRHWELDRPDSLAPLIARLNTIRREHRSFRNLTTLRFHNVDNPALLCFTKYDPAGRDAPLLVVVNVDTEHTQSGFVDVDLAAIGLPYESEYDVADLLGGVTYRWRGNHNFVELSPWAASAHIFAVRPVGAAAAIPGGQA